VTGILWACLGVLGSLGMTALGDMVSEEIRDRLDHLPHAILGLAARRLDPAQRVTVYEDEWLPELTYILKGDEARPVTRLYHGIRYALGIMTAARQVTQRLRREHGSVFGIPMVVSATHVTVLNNGGYLMSHDQLSQVIDRALEARTDDAAYARGIFARRRARVRLNIVRREREKFLGMVQAAIDADSGR
jgi:hypothetical protein